MSELVHVLLLALLPAAGNFLGAVAAELTKTTRRRLSFALHLAAGIIFGVVAVELAPRVFEGAPPWLAGAAFFAGGVFYVALEGLIHKFTGEGHGEQSPEAACRERG